MRSRRALISGVAACLLIAGCGTTKPTPHHVTANRPSIRASLKPTATTTTTTTTSQTPTDPSTGARLTDCGRDIYASSCQFAIAILAKYTAGATQISVADGSGSQYAAQCDSASATTIACYVGSGTYGGYSGDYVVFPTSQIVQTTTAQPTTPQEASRPSSAECSALYAQWRADGEQEDSAIQEYARIGCGQSNLFQREHPTDDWCKTLTADNGSTEQVCDFPPNTPGASAP
jgi:hypothetical protein